MVAQEGRLHRAERAVRIADVSCGEKESAFKHRCTVDEWHGLKDRLSRRKLEMALTAPSTKLIFVLRSNFVPLTLLLPISHMKYLKQLP